MCDAFNRLLKATELKTHGVSFYSLRHTFETVASGTGDQVAVDAIMGHINDEMASLYRERIADDRLLRVVEFVHVWRFCPT